MNRYYEIYMTISNEVSILNQIMAKNRLLDLIPKTINIKDTYSNNLSNVVSFKDIRSLFLIICVKHHFGLDDIILDIMS